MCPYARVEESGNLTCAPAVLVLVVRQMPLRLLLGCPGGAGPLVSWAVPKGKD